MLRRPLPPTSTLRVLGVEMTASDLGIALIRLDTELRAAGIPINGVSGTMGSATVDYAAEATPAQITQGNSIVAAFDWSDIANATWVAQNEKTAATQGVDDAVQQKGNRVERIVMAAAFVALDATNNERQTFVAMNTAVQAATSLADLKTRFAAISFPPQVTMQQLQNAIKQKIAATP